MKPQLKAHLVQAAQQPQQAPPAPPARSPFDALDARIAEDTGIHPHPHQFDLEQVCRTPAGARFALREPGVVQFTEPVPYGSMPIYERALRGMPVWGAAAGRGGFAAGVAWCPVHERRVVLLQSASQHSYVRAEGVPEWVALFGGEAPRALALLAACDPAKLTALRALLHTLAPVAR